MGNKVRINKIIEKTKVEGFGNRYCIWFQGCSIRCKGCANYEMWETTGGTVYNVEDIIKDIERKGREIEGITVLGGEPFEQPEGLYFLTRECKEKGYTVIVFTGFSYEKLLEKEEKRKILAYIDLLIDGPYLEDEKNFDRPWVGSANQRYIFLTERYSEKDLNRIKNKWEIRISKEGSIMINGMGKLDDWYQEGKWLI